MYVVEPMNRMTGTKNVRNGIVLPRISANYLHARKATEKRTNPMYPLTAF